jgi:hypothetical protein
MLRWLALLIAPCLLLLLASCGRESASYRAKMTVVVGTPVGDRSASTVLEIRVGRLLKLLPDLTSM